MKTHKNLTFEVTCEQHKKAFRNPKEAIAHAFVLAASGRVVRFDVLAHSRAAAKAWSGESGIESYNEDPDASVFERYKLSLNFEGRIA